MKNITFNSVCTFFFVLFVSACSKSHEYKVDSAFSDYLKRFENEGAARGRSFNPEQDGLIIEFGTLKDSAAGLTHYETPVRIEIDKTYWDAISKTAGADMMKEDLLFHELGHALLGRKHLNSTLENGDWKSIMCGGEKVNNRSWNINYRGERRKYYLDELFNEGTSAPAFASNALAVDTLGFKSLIQRNFDTESQAIWTIGDKSDYSITLDNGRLRFQSKIDQTYMVFAKLVSPVSVSSNFAFEFTLQYPTGSASNQYGMVFGAIPTTADSTEYFSINNNQKMFLGNRSWYSFYTELTKSSINPGGANKMKIFKIGTMLYYFINNVYCYQSEIFANGNLGQFGFMVPPKGTVWIDNLQISQKTGAAVNSKVKQDIQIVTSVEPVSGFNQNKIYNQ